MPNQFSAETGFPTNLDGVSTSRAVVICGSMRSFALMQQTAERIAQHGVRVLLPLSADTARTTLSRDGYLRVKRDASLYHFDLIQRPDTYAVLAINPERDGVASYIGPNTFADLALAFALGRRIYLLNGIPVTLEDELAAWGAVELHGQLERLLADVDAVTSSDAAPNPQLNLPLTDLQE